MDKPELMEKIIYVHHPNIKKTLLWNAMDKFYELRKVPYLRKKPSTSELIDWLGVLIKAGLTEKDLKENVPFIGTLIKKEQDLENLAKRSSYSFLKSSSSY